MNWVKAYLEQDKLPFDIQCRNLVFEKNRISQKLNIVRIWQSVTHLLKQKMHHRFFSVSFFFFLPKANKSYLPATENKCFLTYLEENWERNRVWKIQEFWLRKILPKQNAVDITRVLKNVKIWKIPDEFM